MANSAKKPLPIGVENFEDMIKKGYYYVDKTLLIQEMIDKGGAVSVFTRPRRFGKSLNISMLQHYFDVLKKDSAHIFDGLKITAMGDHYLQHKNRYPVIKMTLKGVESTTFDSAYKLFQTEIIAEFSRHEYLLSSDNLSTEDKQLFQKFITKEADYEEFKNSLKFLSYCLHRHYNEKTIILIDEYDVPLEKAHFAKTNYYDEMVDFIRLLFGNALKTNDSLNFAIITGCLRISKESIFTGVNNLHIISILDNNYGEYFGFTPKEVDKILDYYDLSHKVNEMRDWYNGYLFGETTVYNPWSSIQYLYDELYGKFGFPRPHWSNTSSNTIIRDLIVDANDEVKDEIEHLIAGGTIIKPITEDIVYSEIKKNMNNLWNFLYFTGYLKKVSKQQIGVHNHMELKIPNKEIQYIYERQIHEWFNDRVQAKDMTILYNAILEQNVQNFEDEIIEFLGESISYLDNHENFYHGFLVGVLQGMKGYRVVSNRETGNGRSDIMIKPRDLRKPAIIIEVKIAERPQNLTVDSKKALQQIEEKNYPAELEYDGYKNVIKYGIAFYQKTCMITKQD